MADVHSKCVGQILGLHLLHVDQDDLHGSLKLDIICIGHYVTIFYRMDVLYEFHMLVFILPVLAYLWQFTYSVQNVLYFRYKSCHNFIKCMQ